MEDTHGGWQGVTGLRQTQKAVAKGLAARVYLACDADPALTEPLLHLCRSAGIPVEQKLTNKIIAGGQRPTENGMNSQGAAVVKSDVSQLSKADRQEIIRRVQRGERIRF